MCGISGLVNFNQKVPLLDYYTAHLRLRHRGTDDEGFFVMSDASRKHYRGDDTIPELATLPYIQEVRAANVVLGHRRLAIIDLSPGGHQPMSDRTGRYTMVYNGEIYNFVELRQELETLGNHFDTQSDAEVLMTAFAQWGPACFNRLNGMWALAIYDTQEQRLILSRDRFGIKPLYYAIAGSTLFFGSEVKFFFPFLPTLQMNEARAIEYLVYGLSDHCAETMFNGICQLSPAHYAVWDVSGLSQHAYWQLSNRQANLTLDEAQEQLAALLTSSITLRLRSDVPIGSLLSGGLDSTTIVCIVRQLLDQQGADNTLDFFSAVFREETFSERRYIEETAAQTGMPVHWVYPDPDKLEETLPRLLYHQEFPFRSLSVYSQWEIMRYVCQTPVKVLLDGQGSDEIFAGYTAHYYALIAEYLRRLRLGKAWREARSFSKAREIPLIKGLASALRRLFTYPAPPPRPTPYLTRSYHWGSQDWNRQRDIFQDELVRNLTFSALPEYLRYEDRNSMAFTLESRLPFMDYRLVEWAMSLPAELKIEGTASKRVLREMARPLIPAVVAQREDKMGFVSPQELWQRTILKPVLDSVFAQDLQSKFSFLNGTKIGNIYEAYQSKHNNNWRLIWRVACLTWWYQYWWEDAL